MRLLGCKAEIPVLSSTAPTQGKQADIVRIGNICLAMELFPKFQKWKKKQETLKLLLLSWPIQNHCVQKCCRLSLRSFCPPSFDLLIHFPSHTCLRVNLSAFVHSKCEQFTSAVFLQPAFLLTIKLSNLETVSQLRFVFSIRMQFHRRVQLEHQLHNCTFCWKPTPNGPFMTFFVPALLTQITLM